MLFIKCYYITAGTKHISCLNTVTCIGAKAFQLGPFIYREYKLIFDFPVSSHLNMRLFALLKAVYKLMSEEKSFFVSLENAFSSHREVNLFF